MKKFILGFAALAAVSTTAFANEYAHNDPRDAIRYGWDVTASKAESAAFAAAGSSPALTAYERVQLQSQETENHGN